MVRVGVDEKQKRADAVTSKYFLTSINAWYKDKGIKCGVERVSKPFENKQDKSKAGIAVTLSILDDMPQCRARAIDADGNVVKEFNEFGEEHDKEVVISDPGEVTFFFNIKVEDSEEEEFKVFPMSSAYPLFNYAFIQDELLPVGNDKNIIFTAEELKESLEGKEFYAHTEKKNFKGGTPYYVLVPKAIAAK